MEPIQNRGAQFPNDLPANHNHQQNLRLIMLEHGVEPLQERNVIINPMFEDNEDNVVHMINMNINQVPLENRSVSRHRG